MTVERNILYDDFVNLVMKKCGYNCQLKDFVMSYIPHFFHNEKDHNLEEDEQDMLNDEFDDVDMNNHDAKIGKDGMPHFESHSPPTLIVGSNIPYSSQSSRVNNVRDDEIDFYKGMTFKNKEELANSLKIACLKKKFKLKKYFENRFPNGKCPSTRHMSNQLHTELSCKVSYWKIYKGMEHTKSNVRGTHEHRNAVLNAYCYMLEIANP
ncbi:hypothetical protein H5410_032773 [Solanum commersonii]|uniref:Uncharacterized protein n=1 Tax=Solanum commersonii TaxID=4109 RepID=A0A9J5YKW3_SOLCO|nr:hypothetical protein H5410_032773 [Solanum commersonii]